MDYASVPFVGNPVIGVRAMVGVPDASAATYSVLLGVPFDLGGRRGRWRAEATAAIETAEADLEVARNDARALAAVAYIACAESVAQYAIAERRTQQAQQLLARVQELFAAQAATTLDVALAEAEVANSNAERAATSRVRARAEADFRAALGLRANTLVVLAPLESPEAAPLDGVTLARRGASRRAEPLSLDRQARRLRLAEDRLYAEAVDPLMVAVEYEAQGNVQTGQTVGVSAQTSLPFVLTAQGDRAVVRGLATLADVEADLSREQIERAIHAAAEALDLTLRELEIVDTQARPAAERALAAIEIMLVSGVVDVFRVLLARREVIALESRRARLLAEAWGTRVRLEREIGGDLP